MTGNYEKWNVFIVYFWKYNLKSILNSILFPQWDFPWRKLYFYFQVDLNGDWFWVRDVSMCCPLLSTLGFPLVQTHGGSVQAALVFESSYVYQSSWYGESCFFEVLPPLPHIQSLLQGCQGNEGRDVMETFLSELGVLRLFIHSLIIVWLWTLVFAPICFRRKILWW